VTWRRACKSRKNALQVSERVRVCRHYAMIQFPCVAVTDHRSSFRLVRPTTHMRLEGKTEKVAKARRQGRNCAVAIEMMQLPTVAGQGHKVWPRSSGQEVETSVLSVPARESVSVVHGSLRQCSVTITDITAVDVRKRLEVDREGACGTVARRVGISYFAVYHLHENATCRSSLVVSKAQVDRCVNRCL